MKRIIGVIHPFDIYQTFYVYEDGNQIEKIQTKIRNIPDTVFELSHTYDIYQIDLSGTEYFNKGIVEQIQKEEITKYNKNKLIIKCI